MIRARVVIAAIALTAPFAPRNAHAEEFTEPHLEPTLPWTLAQAIPSPELAGGTSGTRFGLRWQVTPLLYSFGMHRGLSRWRTFVVEPSTRQHGSLELYFSPEYFPRGYASGDPLAVFAPTGSAHFLLRPGVRAYVPLLERGDYLSASLGGSIYRFQERTGEAIDLGVYVLYGFLGFQFTYSPNVGPVEWITTLRVRAF